jgi:metal-responsive CopG/Arc/MetJ family transcriptional regulator
VVRWYTVADSVFVHRKRLVTSLANELVEPLDVLSKKTRVPKSRLIDEAIEDLLKKYEKRMAE